MSDIAPANPMVNESAAPERDPLERFLHALSSPLSAVALQLESARRALAKGRDPSEALAAARKELEQAFRVFEKGREELLGKEPAP